MAKPKRTPIEFNPSMSRGAFWPGVNIVEEAVGAQNSVEKPKEIAKDDKEQPPNFRAIFSKVVTEGVARTHFPRSRVEYYLPLELRALFKKVNAPGGRLPYDEESQKLLAYVQTNIYGALPDYNSPATADQAHGIVINGKIIDMPMAGKVAMRQMRDLFAKQNVDSNELAREAQARLSQEFGSKAILDIIENRSNGNKVFSRTLVANLIKIAAQLK